MDMENKLQYPFTLQIFIHNVKNYKLIQYFTLKYFLTQYKFDPLSW